MWKRLAFFLLCANLICAVPRPADARRFQEVADEITIKLKGVDGKTYNVTEMRGDVVLVSFGATWCKPCEWELTALEELKQEYQGRPVKFFWVSIESEAEVSNDALRRYAKSQKLSIPVLRDPNRLTFAQFSDRVRLPMVVFFDQKGRFVAPKHTGMSPQPDEYKKRIRSRLDALLTAQAGTNTVIGGK